MNYYFIEAARLGIQGTKVRDLIEQSFQEPTHARLRLCSAALGAVWRDRRTSEEGRDECEQLQAIIEREREELSRVGVLQ